MVTISRRTHSANRKASQSHRYIFLLAILLVLCMWIVATRRQLLSSCWVLLPKLSISKNFASSRFRSCADINADANHRNYLHLFNQRERATHAMAAQVSGPSLDFASDNDSAMPLIGLGTYLLPRDQVYPALRSAVSLGYRRIDCAPVYFNEDAVGNALERILHDEEASHAAKAAAHRSWSDPDSTEKLSAPLRRSDLFVVSKLASPFHRREHVMPALRKTLLDLRLEYLDLYLIHWPVAFRYVPIDPTRRGWDDEAIDDSDGGANIDPTVSVHETWQAMEECVDAGLVRHIGVSNFPVALLFELLTKSRIRPYVNQCEAHPYLPQTRLVEFGRDRGVRFQAYSPLGTPGYKELDEPQLLDEAVVREIAAKHNASPSQVCLAWALQRNTSVVVKSGDAAHQSDNFRALGLRLSPEDVERLNGLHHRQRHRFFRPEDWWGSAGAVFD